MEVKILVSKSEVYYNEAMAHFAKWLVIWDKVINKKRGYTSIRKKMFSMTNGKEYDFFIVFDFNGDYVDISNSARGAYDIARNYDMESFRVVRMTRQGDTLYFNYEPEGWLLTDEISEHDYFDEEGRLREEVKQSAVNRLMLHLALPSET